MTHFILPASQRGNLHQPIVRDDEQRDLLYSAGIPTQEPALIECDDEQRDLLYSADIPTREPASVNRP